MDRIRELIGGLAPAMRSVAATIRTAGLVAAAAGIFIGVTVLRPSFGRVVVGLIVGAVLALPGLVLWDFSRLLADVGALPERTVAGSREIVQESVDAVTSARAAAGGTFWARLRAVISGLFDASRVGRRVQELGVLDLGRLISPFYLVVVLSAAVAGLVVIALALLVGVVVLA